MEPMKTIKESTLQLIGVFSLLEVGKKFTVEGARAKCIELTEKNDKASDDLLVEIREENRRMRKLNASLSTQKCQLQQKLKLAEEKINLLEAEADTSLVSTCDDLMASQPMASQPSDSDTGAHPSRF